VAPRRYFRTPAPPSPPAPASSTSPPRNGARRLPIASPGARSSERWPPRKFAALARRLAADLGFDVLIEGGPADAPVLDAVAEHLRGTLPALPDAPSAVPRVAVYQDPLGVLAALLEQASLLVSNDSAPIHLAEACAAPTLYFAHREKLTHSHPAGPACWALFDAGRNRLARITVDQAMAAIAEMVRLGEVRRAGRVERSKRAGQVERVEKRLAGGT
jgi:ADP-heptose:LPS heptosyltransferase